MKTNTKNRGRTASLSVSKASAGGSVSRRLWGVALAFLLGGLLFVPQSARGGEISVGGGYGVLRSPKPLARLSLSFGKRVVLGLQGGVIFASSDTLRFAEFTKTFSVQEKVKDVKIPKGNQLYSIGLEIRALVRKSSKKHNVYLGGGVDWLPQLEIYYPGAKVVAGYQLSLLEDKDLVLRFGAEYYVYGVVPANALALTTSVGYKF